MDPVKLAALINSLTANSDLICSGWLIAENYQGSERLQYRSGAHADCDRTLLAPKNEIRAMRSY